MRSKRGQVEHGRHSNLNSNVILQTTGNIYTNGLENWNEIRVKIWEDISENNKVGQRGNCRVREMWNYLLWTTLGTGAQIPTRYMVKTLRAQSTCDSNVPSDQMLSTFWIYPVMWPQYAQWVHAEYILNVPSHVTPMYPVGKQSGTFWMFGKMQSQCAQWVTWWIYSKYVFRKCLNVPTGQELISFTMDLVTWL